MAEPEIPIQPPDNPILCSPYEEPHDYWIYERDGLPRHGGKRRPAGYFYLTERMRSQQLHLLAQEEWEELALVNRLREDVRRWREAGYRGASTVTRHLLRHWTSPERTQRDARRLFFCQREAVETIIYLAELRMTGKTTKTEFKRFEVSDDDLQRLLRGETPSYAKPEDFPQFLIDRPFDPTLLPLRRLGCKMATGSGKTVVMAMLIAWAFCNRGMNPRSSEFPNAVLICCPNLTVKERLQVLRPDHPRNYYQEFDLVPGNYGTLLQSGKVLIENWHRFQPESEHKEGDRTWAVVDKGPETPDVFARRVLGDLADRMPIMVLNDEGHHCWRPAPNEQEELTAEQRKELELEMQEATVWVEGLDRINNAGRLGRPGIGLCVDLSATPFYIKGSGYPEGRPFPWLVSDFGLVDAIESGIVKIPRLPVSDTTGRPEPKYFRLWEWMRERLEPAEFLPGKARKPKPEAVWRETEAALIQLAEQWHERFEYLQSNAPGRENVPPVMIVVCDNTDIAEFFYQKLSGEREEPEVTEEDVAEVLSGDEETEPSRTRRKSKRPKMRTAYGQSAIRPEFSNTPDRRYTIRIDSTRLDELEELRRIVATVGKPGEPGEHVRCVVSVSMLTEGWDANTVTHILGVRAFGSQLLCEQVVGRGLRRMDYKPTRDERTGKDMLHPEYVDVYGIPFSVIPFKGRPVQKPAPEDKPKWHVKAVEERQEMEMRFPVVETYAYALRRNLIRCDLDGAEPLQLEPSHEPTATFLNPTYGYQIGPPSSASAFVEHNRQAFYASSHLQTIKFQITGLITDRLTTQHEGGDKRQRVLRLQSRHQLFPQVFRFVDEYVDRKVDFQDEHPCELGLQRYIERIVERLYSRIEPDDQQGEAPLVPVLNRYKPIGTTAEVDFKTTRECRATTASHLNLVVLDTQTWESTLAFRLERAAQQGVVQCYARNDHLGLTIPYEFQGIDHSYSPDFLVRLSNGLTLLLELKGQENEQTRAKHSAARRWVSAVNNWGELGRWDFHVCRNPQKLEAELQEILRTGSAPQPDEAEEDEPLVLR